MPNSTRAKDIQQSIVNSRHEASSKGQPVLNSIIITNWLESQKTSTLPLNKVLSITELIQENKNVKPDETTGSVNTFITGLAHLTSISNLLDYDDPKSKDIIEILYQIFITTSAEERSSVLLSSIFHSIKAHDVKQHGDCEVVAALKQFYLPVSADNDKKQQEIIKVAEELIKFKACPWMTKAYRTLTESGFPADIAILFK